MTRTYIVRHREEYTTAINYLLLGYYVQAGKYLIFNIDETLVMIYKTPFLIDIIMASTCRVNFEREVLEGEDVKKDRMFKLC